MCRTAVELNMFQQIRVTARRRPDLQGEMPSSVPVTTGKCRGPTCPNLTFPFLPESRRSGVYVPRAVGVQVGPGVIAESNAEIQNGTRLFENSLRSPSDFRTSAIRCPVR